MLGRDNFIDDTLKRLKEINIGQCLDIRSYKKNRKVVIEKIEDFYNIYEDGYNTENYMNLEYSSLKKLLKNIEKVEFPRSNKLRFYILDSIEDSVCRANYRDEKPIIEEVDERLEVKIITPYQYLEIAKNIITSQGGEIYDIEFLDKAIIKGKIYESTEQVLIEKTRSILKKVH